MNEYKPKINLSKSFLFIALIIALMALAGWLLRRENFYQMFEVLRGTRHSFVGLAIGIYFFSVVIWTIRWHIALSSSVTNSIRKLRESFATLYMIICSGIFLNNITPMARVGGDPFGRVYLLRKLENVEYSSGMAASIGEHVFAPLFVVSFLMAGLFLQFGKDSLRLGYALIAVWALVTPGMVFLPRLFFQKRVGVSRISGIINHVLGWFQRRLNLQEIIAAVQIFYSSVYAMIDRRGKGLWIGGLTLLIWALDICRLYIVFLALGYHPNLAMLLFASSVPVIVGLIPFLPGGLLLVEGSLVSVLTFSGVPLNVAMAVTVIERGISYVLSSIVGAGIFSYLGFRIAVKPEMRN